MPFLKKHDMLTQKRMKTSIYALLIAFVYFVFAWSLEFNTIAALLHTPLGLWGFLIKFAPTTASFKELARIWLQLYKTILVSISSTVIATATALIASILGSTTMGKSRILRLLIRLVASVLRNIPMAAWAMILLISFKQSEFTGFLALYLGTFGLLVRAFIELVDATGRETLEAFDALAASYWQKIFCCIVPNILPQVMSWLLYMIETNLRSATLVGILTGTGIGFLFDLFFKSFRYAEAGLVVWSIVVVVVGIEYVSNYVRKVFI